MPSGDLTIGNDGNCGVLLVIKSALAAARPGCILPEGSWQGSCLNRLAKDVICVSVEYCTADKFPAAQ